MFEEYFKAWSEEIDRLDRECDEERNALSED